jgi:hypothetical protein
MRIMNRLCRIAALSVALLPVVATRHSHATVTDDRRFLLGDDAGENAVAGAIVGSASTPVTGLSRDSQGPTGAFFHLSVNGAPTYVSVADRPGATPGALGANFNGPGSGDRLSSPFSLNQPTAFWDNRNFFPLDSDPNTPLFTLNYEDIRSHGIQLWAKPNGATQNARQDVVIDTPENGIYISATNRWSLQYNNQGLEGSAFVAYNAWTHVMQVAGSIDPDDGRANLGGVLYVNGIAVAASPNLYGFNETALSIGGNQAGDGNFYHGALDNVRLFLWGNNVRQTNDGAGPNGQEWGNFNLGDDNEWIARELAARGVTSDADVNLDGSVTPADVTAFLPDWASVNLVNGLAVGDWNSRQNGDLNYDGIVDLDDAVMLHQGLLAAGFSAGLDFSRLGVVPEPTAALMALIALLARGAARSSRCRE